MQHAGCTASHSEVRCSLLCFSCFDEAVILFLCLYGDPGLKQRPELTHGCLGYTGETSTSA